MTQNGCPVDGRAALFTLLLPGMLWVAYSLLSYPLMYPGFDVWIHLASMEFEGRRQDIWHQAWGAIFTVFGLESYFTKAKLIHSTQLLITGGLLFVAARWLLQLVFAGRQLAPAALNLAAWLAVLVWAIMHGTNSSPIGSGIDMWHGWLQRYSVNYQVALPLYVFAVAALLYGLFGHLVHHQALQRWPYLVAAVLATFGVAALHAAELPYVLLVVVFVGVLWMRWAWRWYYVAAVLALLALLWVGLQFSHRLPTGFMVLAQSGPAALLEQVYANGVRMVGGLNRGNASWNYWYWVSLVLAGGAWLILWRLPRVPTRGHQLRMAGLVLASALPAAMLHFTWTAGALAMVTYPALAWRFTFSSLLFLGPAMALLALALYWPRAAKLWVQAVLAGALVVAVLLASRQTETNWVSYQYARGVALSLSPQHMRFGLQPDQQKWLNDVHSQLLANPPEQLVCTDMFTAYYLFFVKGYDNVVLPRRISRFIDKKRREGECRFPRDGGDLQRLNLGPVPWHF